MRSSNELFKHLTPTLAGLLAERLPLSILAQLAAIAFLAFLVGFALPAAAALRGHTYYESGLENIVQQRHPEAFKKHKDYLAKQSDLKKQIAELDKRVASLSGGSESQAAEWAGLRGAYQEELNEPPPISIQPFDLHTIMYFWPIMYVCLGIIVFLLRPHGVPMPVSFSTVGKTLAIAFGIFVFIFWALWVRTEHDTEPDQGRVVFAYSNPELDPGSFAVQHLNFAVYAVLLAVIWQQWSAFIVQRQRELGGADSNGASDPLDPTALRRLSDTLMHWQLTFFVISLGFIIHTAIFWNQIIGKKDQRFLFEAISVHTIWLITTVLTATPLILTWRTWQLARLQMIVRLATAGAETDKAIETKLSTIKELRPIGSWKAAAMGATVLTSFVIPVVQAFFRIH
jgi:hypothetical protein